MTDTFDAELGRPSGMGLARMMLEALVKRGTDVSAATVPVAPHVVAAYPRTVPTAAAAASVILPPGRPSSRP